MVRYLVRPLLAVLFLLIAGIWSPPAAQMMLGAACADLRAEHQPPPDWGDAELEDTPELEDTDDDDDDDASTGLLEGIRVKQETRARLTDARTPQGHEHRNGVDRPPRTDRV